MYLSVQDIRNQLSERGLKVSPQRICILEAINNLNNHPTAEKIIEHIHQSNPNIANGTVYRVLDILVKNQLIKRVKTDGNFMRYDGITEPHHHIYISVGDFIKDYIDKELDELLEGYFKSKKIDGFKIEEINLQIRGTIEKNQIVT